MPATNDFYAFRIYGDLGPNAQDIGSSLISADLSNPYTLFLQSELGGMYTNYYVENDISSPSYNNEAFEESYSLQHIMPFIHYGWPFTLRTKQKILSGSSESQIIKTLTVRAITTEFYGTNYWEGYYPTFYSDDNSFGWNYNNGIGEMLEEMLEGEEDPPPWHDWDPDPPEPPTKDPMGPVQPG